MFDYGVVNTKDWDECIHCEQAGKGDEYRSKYSLLPSKKDFYPNLDALFKMLPQTLFSDFALRIQFDDYFMAGSTPKTEKFHQTAGLIEWHVEGSSNETAAQRI